MSQKTDQVRSRVAPQDVRSTLGKYILTDGYECILDLEKSHGSYLHDGATGRTFLDFFTCFASSPIGFNHPGMREAAFLEELTAVALHNPSNSDLYTPQYASFVETFAEAAAPKEMARFFFISGGALAVENALKAAFDWKIRRNRIRGATGEVGTKILHFREAFHGRSGYTLSLTNTSPVKTDLFPKFDWPRITNPKITFPLEGENLQAVCALEARALEEIDAAVRKHGDDLAALIIEPIQAEGGDHHFRGEFLRELRRVTEENEILLVVDEVQTGMGITGSWWAYQRFGFVPDLIAFGKKAQVCGIMAAPKLDEEEGVFRVSGRINSTWGGSLVDMVRSRRMIEIIRDQDYVGNAAARGEELLVGLRDLQAAHEGWISNARGLGLMCAFDMPSPEDRDRLLGRLYENGMMVLACGERSVRFRPILNVSPEEIGEGLEILGSTLKGF